MILKFYQEDNLVLEEEFSSKAYKEDIYVFYAKKYNLVELPDNYFLNNLEGLKVRREYFVEDSIKAKIYDLVDNDTKKLLDIINNKTELSKLELNEFTSLISGLHLSPFEDINSFIDENKKILDKVTRLIIIF